VQPFLQIACRRSIWSWGLSVNGSGIDWTDVVWIGLGVDEDAPLEISLSGASWEAGEAHGRHGPGVGTDEWESAFDGVAEESVEGWLVGLVDADDGMPTATAGGVDGGDGEWDHGKKAEPKIGGGVVAFEDEVPPFCDAFFGAAGEAAFAAWVGLPLAVDGVGEIPDTVFAAIGGEGGADGLDAFL
jgi:hypothetical protein